MGYNPKKYRNLQVGELTHWFLSIDPNFQRGHPSIGFDVWQRVGRGSKPQQYGFLWEVGTSCEGNRHHIWEASVEPLDWIIVGKDINMTIKRYKEGFRKREYETSELENTTPR